MPARTCPRCEMSLPPGVSTCPRCGASAGGVSEAGVLKVLILAAVATVVLSIGGGAAMFLLRKQRMGEVQGERQRAERERMEQIKAEEKARMEAALAEAKARALAAAAGQPVEGAPAERVVGDERKPPATLDLAEYGGPSNLDVLGMYPKVLAMVRETLPDAELTELRAFLVKPDGRADLTLGDDFVRYHFRSLAASKQDESKPIGVKQKLTCKMEVFVSAKGVRTFAREEDSSDCHEQLLLPPACSYAEVWQRAIALGAPKNAVAEIRYDSNSRNYQGKSGPPWDVPRRAGWRVMIEGGERGSFDKSFLDECGAARRDVAKEAAVSMTSGKTLWFEIARCYGTIGVKGMKRLKTTWDMTVDGKGEVTEVKVKAEADGTFGPHELTKAESEQVFRDCGQARLKRQKVAQAGGRGARVRVVIPIVADGNKLPKSTGYSEAVEVP